MNERKPYNRLILVGNGFDLAAGLETSYASFINSYIKDCVIQLIENNKSFSSELIELNLGNHLFYSLPKEYIGKVECSKTPEETLELVKHAVNIHRNNQFFSSLLINCKNYGWVDIEDHYYKWLKVEFKKSHAESNRKIKSLNNTMDVLTAELNKYLAKVQKEKKLSPLNSPLTDLLEKVHSPFRTDIAQLVKRHGRLDSPQNILFLNFNYTNTVKQLTSSLASSMKSAKHIHIHGSIGDTSNPLIFGYGDDTGDEYTEFELAGIDELLRKIKSFQYPRTKNYHNLLNFLEEEEFDVIVLGHSCGLSDRTLLKTIFEHRNCMCIQNYHYKGEDEDFYKRMAISRHFSNKVLMRERVLPFDSQAVIPQAR